MNTNLFSILDAEHGFPTYDAGIASDDLADLKLKLSTAFDHGDLVVTTGGVSMGDKDLLRQILVQVSLLVCSFCFLDMDFELDLASDLRNWTWTTRHGA